MWFAIWSLSGENLLQTKQQKTIYVQVNVSNKRCNHFLKKLCREIFYPLVLLAVQSPSPSICSVTNMYEQKCKCLYLSLSVGCQKMLLLNASMAPLCKGKALFRAHHSAALFAFWILFRITLCIFQSFFFSSAASNSNSLFCKLSPLSHYIIFLPKCLCSPTFNNLVSPKPDFAAVS